MSAYPAVRRAARSLRILLACGVASLAACSDITGSVRSFPVDDSLQIRRVNSQIGTTAWHPSKLALASDLAVWASPYSARPGDTLDVYVHSTRGSVDVSIYRLGWYQGTGGLLMKRQHVTAWAQSQCSAPFPGPVTCPWTVTTRIPLPTSLISGVYMVNVEDSTGTAALYPFVLRSEASSNFVVVIPQLTWQAYNDFGGSSLYTKGPDGHLGHLVSFDRPYALNGGATYLYGVGYSNEMSVLLWLERQGYDVSYISDVDVSAIGRSVAPPRKGLLFPGHDEYWTINEFDEVKHLRDSGVHLAFFGGNSAYWRVRTSPGTVTGRADEVVACYKADPDPDAATSADRTTWFRGLDRPENALVGTGYVQHAYGGPYPLVAADSDLNADGESFLAAAGLGIGDSIPDFVNTHVGTWPKFASLEGNQVIANGVTPPGLQVLFRLPYSGGVNTPTGVFETTFYRAPSGAGVFSAGINEWGRYLSGFYQPEDTQIASLMAGVFSWMRHH